MQIEYADCDLERLATDLGFTAGFGREIVKGFRKRIQSIEAALDERDLHNVRGNRYEKLKGKRDHEHSMRINDQWRLIFEIKPSKPGNIILITKVEDYH